MSAYEPNQIAHTYTEQVKDYLINDFHMTDAEAENVISQGNLFDCICGCPYIANHYPHQKAASLLAKKYARSCNMSFSGETAEIHHATY
ncbi:MAG: hypothetical protein E7221_07355 [Clostridiales bacterium]|nr:hypothetical protein [Clostridiales bacterium]